MITKRIDELTFSDIERLVEQKVPESRVLDYKRQLPNGTSDEVKELLADVTSFANASGGHLVFGITTAKVEGKNTSIPESIVGVGVINSEEVENRLDAQLRSLIQPRIAGLRIRVIAEEGNPVVVVIHIPRSWNAPHMVAKGSSKFYSRTSTGKQPLDVTEIRNAFAMSESVGEKIKSFRDERVGRILAGETPIQTSAGPILVVHCIPLTSFTEKTVLSLDTLKDASKKLRPLNTGSHYDERNNLDGVLKYIQIKNLSQSGYVQVFRNGSIETVDAYLIRNGHRRTGANVISATDLECGIMLHINDVCGFIKQIFRSSPVIVLVDILNVRGFNLIQNAGCIPGLQPIDRDHLLLPDLLVEDLDIPAETFLRPIFDLIWQACNAEKCPSYGDDGNRIN